MVAVSVAVCPGMRGHLGARTLQVGREILATVPRLACMRRQLPKLDVAGSTPVARSREVAQLDATAGSAARRRGSLVAVRPRLDRAGM